MSNLESVQGLYAAFAKDDVPTVLGFFGGEHCLDRSQRIPIRRHLERA
jgi:hypothetical protein